MTTTVAKATTAQKIEKKADRTQTIELGERIRLARERKGLSIADLAKLIGRSRSTVTNHEMRGKTPPATDIPLYCKVLEISADELLGLEEADSWGNGYMSGYDLGWLDAVEAITTAAKDLSRREWTRDRTLSPMTSRRPQRG